MNKKRIPVAGPWITQREVRYVTDAVTSNWYGNASDYIQRFEMSFATMTNRTFAVSLPSCTAAIHLALSGLGVGPGDEVILPDVTWIASAAPVSYVGATPVFVDIDAQTWCISPCSLEAALTKNTKAVIAVDLYGNMPHFQEILEIAAEHSLPVIEDAAEAVGSSFMGQVAGSFGTTSVFSFHGSKTLTTGEGGMLVTDDEQLFERVLVLRDHGRAPGDKMFFNAEVGFKYKMSSMQAALGLAQLERLDELVARKREIFTWYRERLDGRVQLNTEPPRGLNSYWMVTAVVPESGGLRTENLMSGLEAEGIDSRPFFHPLSSLPAYREIVSAARARQQNVISYSVSPRGINLPSALSLTEDDVDRVASVLLKMLEAV